MFPENGELTKAIYDRNADCLDEFEKAQVRDWASELTVVRVAWLVSTHVVCERLSAMQGLPECGIVKFLLRIPIHNLVTQEYPITRKLKFGQILALLSFDYPRILSPLPRKLKFRQILALWVLPTQEYPPPQKMNEPLRRMLIDGFVRRPETRFPWH